MTDARPVLTARGLTKSYRGRLVLTGVDLDIAAGETVGLVGTSGAGKSTLIRCLADLERPTSGTVHWDGRPAGQRPPRPLQTVFQDPRASLDPRWTIGRSVGEPLLAPPAIRDHGARSRRVVEVLDLVGLPSALFTRYPHELSTGQCQRACLARALAPRPQVLLLDEPLSALDLPVQAHVLELLRELQARTATAYLFVSHDVVLVATLCRRIEVLHQGTIVEELSGPTPLSSARHPHTRALVADTPRLPPRS